MRVQPLIFSRHPTPQITYLDSANQALSYALHFKKFCQLSFVHDVIECAHRLVISADISGTATDLLQCSRNGLNFYATSAYVKTQRKTLNRIMSIISARTISTKEFLFSESILTAFLNLCHDNLGLR